MEVENCVTLRLRLTRVKLVLLFAGFFLCLHPRFLGSETMTLTTYYPAPYGAYSSLMTTGGAVGGAVLNTLLARDQGNVGIGTPTPASKLSVSRGLQIGNDPAACGAANTGTLRWNSGKLQMCDGTIWKELAGVGAVLYGGAYTQAQNGSNPGITMKYGSSPFCPSPNLYTGNCSCPAGYDKKQVGYAGYWHYNAWDSVYWGYICEKLPS